VRVECRDLVKPLQAFRVQRFGGDVIGHGGYLRMYGI
jgi:hypothetical protein